MYDIRNTARTATLRAQFVRWGRPLTEQLVALREADIRGCGYRTDYVHARWRALLAEMAADGTPFSEAELAIDGAGIMRALGIAPARASDRSSAPCCCTAPAAPRTIPPIASPRSPATFPPFLSSLTFLSRKKSKQKKVANGRVSPPLFQLRFLWRWISFSFSFFCSFSF